MDISRREFLTLGGIVGIGTGAALLTSPLNLLAGINTSQRVNRVLNFLPENVEIRNHVINLSQIKNNSNFPVGINIGLISDPHINEFNSESIKQLIQILSLNLDILIINGDFIPKNSNGINEYFGILDYLMRKMQGKVFGVLGNHDYIIQSDGTITDNKELLWQLKKWGVTILENNNIQLQLRGEKVNLIGKGSFLRGKFLAKNEPIADNNGLNILITHEPIGFQRSQDTFDIGVAGHTHGSPDWLIELAKISSLLDYKTSFNEFDFKYNNGLFIQGNKFLLTTSGIGRHDIEKYFTQKYIDMITIA